MESTFGNCLIYIEDKLSTIEFREYIIPHLKIIIYSHTWHGSTTSMCKSKDLMHFLKFSLFNSLN